MKYVTRLTVGLFGLVFHLAMAGLLAAKAARAAASDLGAMLGPTVAAAVAAFVVYALVVTPYARKRYGTAKKGVVLYDFLIGMLAEVAVVALAALLWAIPSAAPAFAQGGVGGYFANVLRTASLGFLWAIGTAMTEIFAIGNGAGFAGFIVLKKLAAREARAAAAREPPGADVPAQRRA